MFRLQFITDNAAFDDSPKYEISRILEVIAVQVGAGNLKGKVFDCNGNTVGTYKLDKA